LGRYKISKEKLRNILKEYLLLLILILGCSLLTFIEIYIYIYS
jgi:hypothetical protein